MSQTAPPTMDPDIQHLLRVMRDKGILRITHDYPLTEAQEASETDIEVWYTAPELGTNGRRRVHYNSNQLDILEAQKGGQ